jgi:hypothetical protein
VARAFAAAELGAGEPGAGAEEIEERHAGIHVPVPELEALAVDGEHHRLSRRGRRRGGRRSHRAAEKRGACRDPIPIWVSLRSFAFIYSTRLPLALAHSRQAGSRSPPNSESVDSDPGPMPRARVVSARG